VRKRQQLWILLGVFALAALMRVGLAGRQGLWADEVFSLAMATGHSVEHPAAVANPALGDFVEPDRPVPVEEFRRYLRHDNPPASPARVVRAVLLSDTNPPLYYLLLYGWTLVVGTSDVALRLFSTVWSLACLPLLAAVARRTAGRRAAIAACVLFAFAPLSVYYSTEGRMYSLLLFCTLATAWLSLALRRPGSRGWLLALWILASAAGFLTHYFFVFVWVAMVTFLLLRPGRLARGHLGLGVLLTLLAILPWYANVPETLNRWIVTQDWLKWEPAGFSRPGAARDRVLQFFSGRGGGLWGNARHADRAALFLFALVAGAMAWRLRLRAFCGRRLFLWLWLGAACAGPFALDLLRGTYSSAVPRYVLAGLPAAYLLAAMGLSCAGRRAGAVGLALIVLAWAPNLMSIYRNDSRSWSPFREVARAVTTTGTHSDLVLVHSIPSGVLGIARYADGPAAIASWVGQLGQRRVPESIEALAAGRARILLVKIHEVGEPAPEEDWLRAKAAVFREARHGSARIVEFRPRDAERF